MSRPAPRPTLGPARAALLLLGALAACETEFPGTPPPATCLAGEHVCFVEPHSDRHYVLRCNAGEVAGAIWLIDEVCLDGAVCEVDRCVPPGGAP